MNKFSETFTVLLFKNKSLSYEEKEIITYQYIDTLKSIENDLGYTYYIFILLSNITMICGVIMTSLITLNHYSDFEESDVLFWVSWTLSLFLTVINKFIHARALQKKYVINMQLLEKLSSEGRAFISESGRYRNLGVRASYLMFCERVELIAQRASHARIDIEEGSGGSQNGTPSTSARRLIDSMAFRTQRKIGSIVINV